MADKAAQVKSLSQIGALFWLGPILIGPIPSNSAALHVK